MPPLTPIRYRLPFGDRFTIEALTRERITVGDREVVDLEAGFALGCEVVRELGGEVVEIAGVFGSPKVSGTAPLLPPLEDLAGRRLLVRKGLDGRIHGVRGAEPVEAMFGGLTAANALTWFAAVFAREPVGPGMTWTHTDRWALRSDRTPLGVRLPLVPVLDVRYRYRLERIEDGDGGTAEIDVEMDISGGGRSLELGLELEASGVGRGHVTVDLDSGKLVSSTKIATLDLVPWAVRRGALALPALEVERRSDAGFRS